MQAVTVVTVATASLVRGRHLFVPSTIFQNLRKSFYRVIVSIQDTTGLDARYILLFPLFF